MGTEHIQFVETTLSRMNKAIGTGQILAKIINQDGQFVVIRPLSFSHILGHGIFLQLEQDEDRCGRKGAFLYFQPFGEYTFKSVFTCTGSFEEIVFGPTVTIEWLTQAPT